MHVLDLAPGRAIVVWDGRADNGMRAAPGKYTATVRVTDVLGKWRQERS